MDIDWLREFCLSLPHTTESIQWGDDLVFKIVGKMYAVVRLEPRMPSPHLGHAHRPTQSDIFGQQRPHVAAPSVSFKCSPDDFAALIDRPGIIPAPYLARAHWVAIETDAAVSRAELQGWLSQAHALIFAKLSKKAQFALNQPRGKRKKR
jgi:predicted DNA-binding protein (MmcQ/YjbR family)